MLADRSFWNRRIRARDGVELAADVLLPVGKGPFPTLLLRTPYGRSRTLGDPLSWVRFVNRGYALVAVDLRGRGDSEGEWTPWLMDPQDAHDTVEWVAAQPWCTGNVGMVGGSYEGATQWWTVAGKPKHLRCIVPLAVGGVRPKLPSFGTGIPSQYRIWWSALVFGRTQQNACAPSWEARMMHLPLRTLAEEFGLTRGAWPKYVAGEIEFGGDAGTLPLDAYPGIDIPVLIGAGWWDDQSTMRAWQAVQRAKSAKDCRLLIGAWDHAGNVSPRPFLGGVDVSASMMDTLDYIEQFLALHLKGEQTPIASEPRCKVFLTGENRWDALEEWPHPAAIETPIYLTSAGDACSLRGNGRLTWQRDEPLGSDTFVYDPNEPGRDMTSLSTFAWADPPLDQRYLQRRMDTLVYTSDVLSAPMMVSGRYRLGAFLSCDRPDTDLYVSITDVHPDGRAVGLAPTNVLSACLRVRYRNGSAAELMSPGQIYEVTVEGSWLHHVFKQGHRVRITLSSGNFPLMSRNAGTGGHWAEDEILYPQSNTIHHSSEYPTHVVLPIVYGAPNQ